jgi:tRNA nucleotidyltransferase (CCA-adding enzyme)
LSVTVPVDIDIALDDKLGREFADELNQWLSDHGRETHSVGVVLKNPEKSKHLETATMRVNNYWIDFVNLRAEEYTSDSRIPDLMRIGTPEEDSFRRDLTINSLFYNINEGIVEDMTGRGLDDLRRGIVATPLPPLTTLLDDPLRVLRSVRFAARLRFTMSDELRTAAADKRVKAALEQKVSRERVGSEVDLMLKSRDPVGAMRLLVNLGLIDTVFPLPKECLSNGNGAIGDVFEQGLALLSTTHGHLCDCKANPPMWCEAKRALESGAVNGVGKEETRVLMEDEDARRLLWYAAFLKPLKSRFMSSDDDAEAETRKKPRKAKRSVILRLLVDELKRPIRDADQVEKIMNAADCFTKLVLMGSDISALSVLLSGAQVMHDRENRNKIVCSMNTKIVEPDTEDDPVWLHCMEFRKNCADALRRIGPLWRAAFILSLCEQLMDATNDEVEYMIEGDIVSSIFKLIHSVVCAKGCSHT